MKSRDTKTGRTAADPSGAEDKMVISGKMSPDVETVAERFFASERDRNWPSTPMRKRMQGSGR